MTIIRIGYIEVGKSDTGSGKQKVATLFMNSIKIKLFMVHICLLIFL